MTTNPILEEIRQTREVLLAESGGTLAGLVERLQREERESGRAFFLPRSKQTSKIASSAAPVADSEPATVPSPTPASR